MREELKKPVVGDSSFLQQPGHVALEEIKIGGNYVVQALQIEIFEPKPDKDIMRSLRQV